jgi:hypothetical protein
MFNDIIRNSLDEVFSGTIIYELEKDVEGIGDNLI